MNQRGSLLVEMVLVVTMGTVSLAAALTLVRAVLDQRRAYAATRLAAFLASSGVVPWTVAEQEAADFWAIAAHAPPARWRVTRFDESAAARFYPLLQVRVQSAVVRPERVVMAEEE